LKAGNGSKLDNRRKDHIRTLRKASKHHDVLFGQEVKYNHNLENSFEGFVQSFHFFHNPLSTQSAGTFIAIRRSYLEKFTYREEVLVPGYLQQVLLSPKDASTSAPFSLLNVYLYTGNKRRWAKVKSQLEVALTAESSDFNFALGDFNLALEKEDYTGPTRTVSLEVRDLCRR
jgi:exonuclease III